MLFFNSGNDSLRQECKPQTRSAHFPLSQVCRSTTISNPVKTGPLLRRKLPYGTCTSRSQASSPQPLSPSASMTSRGCRHPKDHATASFQRKTELADQRWSLTRRRSTSDSNRRSASAPTPPMSAVGAALTSDARETRSKRHCQKTSTTTDEIPIAACRGNRTMSDTDRQADVMSEFSVH
jgi:hypothetical protein